MSIKKSLNYRDSFREDVYACFSKAYPKSSMFLKSISTKELFKYNYPKYKILNKISNHNIIEDDILSKIDNERAIDKFKSSLSVSQLRIFSNILLGSNKFSKLKWLNDTVNSKKKTKK